MRLIETLAENLGQYLGRLPAFRTGEADQGPELRPRLAGTEAIARLRPRRRARVGGVLRAVTYHTGNQRPALVGRLVDATGSLDLVWMGQRRIAGIVPGALLIAEGMVGQGRQRPQIYNPVYELLEGEQ